MREPQSLFAARRWLGLQVFAAKRSLATNECYWFWTWGRWDFSLGLFRGFGLGVLIFRDEGSLTLGPVGLHAERVES